jgi:hypothetical protein
MPDKSIDQIITDAKVAGKIAKWSYGDKVIDNDWVVLLETNDLFYNSGFKAFLMVNKYDSTQLWYGIAGTDQAIDTLQFSSIYGLSGSSQVRDMYRFYGDVKRYLGLHPEYSISHLKISGESWGGGLGAVLSNATWIRAYAIDSPGMYGYIDSRFYYDDLAYAGMNRHC